MDLYGADYGNVHNTPVIGAALDDWVNENYSPDHFVVGTLALDADRQVIDVRVYIEATGPARELVNTPHGEGREAWDDLSAWLTSLGASAGVSFVRRPRVSRFKANPQSFDMAVADSTRRLYRDIGVSYIGHLIIERPDYGLVMPASGGLDDTVREQLADGLIEKLSKQDDIDPVILDALRIARDGDLTNEANANTVLDAIDKLSAIIAEGPQQRPPTPFDLPPIRKDDDRPDVPGAFYH